METMQPTLRIGRNVWDRVNLPETEFQERIEKIKETMKKEGIDVLFLYGSGFNEYGNACYLTNFVVRLPQGALAAVPQNGGITLLFEGSSRMLPTVKKTTWVEDITACRDVSQEMVKYLKEKNLIPSKIGFVGIRQLMPYNQYQFLSESLDQCEIVDADQIISDMRMVKSSREQDQIRRASRVVAGAFTIIAETQFLVMDERILEATIFRAARLEGGGDIRVLLAKPGKTKWALRPAEETSISAGDTVIIYVAVEIERYWAEGIRTFVVKDSSLEELEANRVSDLYDRIVKGVTPGKSISQFHMEALSEIEKSNAAFIPDYGLGSGIGLSLEELPVISEKDTTLFSDGMCLTLRLALQDEESGAVMVGNTVLLSQEGPEVLTR